MLNELELGDALDRAKDVDDRKRMHDGSIATNDEIGRAPEDFLDDVQAASLATSLLAHADHVACTVTDERLCVRAKASHHCLPKLAWRYEPPRIVEHFEKHALAREQYLAARRLV